MSESGVEGPRAPLARVVRVGPSHYAGAIAGCVATTVVASFIADYFDLANIVMLFLLTVLLVAVWLGRGPAVMAAFLSVALFDFFFVPPKLSFAVHDAQYLLTFTVMLIVALVTGELTAGLRRQAQDASLKAARTHALYDMARELSGVLSLEQAVAVLRRFVLGMVRGRVAVFIADNDAALKLREIAPADGTVFDRPIVELVFNGANFIALDSKGYFPLKTSSRARGVMCVSFAREDLLTLEEHRELLDAVASLMAIVVERLHYADIARQGEPETKTERMRSSALSATPHDIPTPITR